MTNTRRPCSALLPGHRHCEHGHTEDCLNPGECPLIPVSASTPVPPVTFVTSGRSDYSDAVTTCCGDNEHRPAGGAGTWFCMSCGKTRLDNPPAKRA